MVFYRIVGALILAFSGVAGAYWMNQAASASLAQTEGWIALLRYVKVQVECFALPVSAILAKCDPALLATCGYEQTKPPQNLEELLIHASIRDGETGGILRGFVDEFGKSYREEQVRSCEYYCALLGERRDSMASQLPGKKKLNSTLCVAGTLAIVILLL